jgi:uncharacterized protein YjcR
MHKLQREGLWDKFYMDAPARQRQYVLNGLAEQYGINPKTVAKWKKRSFANDAPMGPKEVRECCHAMLFAFVG